MSVIPLRNNIENTISVPLPNGKVFNVNADMMHDLFENPKILLSDEDIEGLLMLAIAVVFADHNKNKKLINFS